MSRLICISLKLKRSPEWGSPKRKWVECRCQWLAMSAPKSAREAMDARFPMNRLPSANWTNRCTIRWEHVRPAVEWTSAPYLWCWTMPSIPMTQSRECLSCTTFSCDRIYRARSCTTDRRTDRRLRLSTLKKTNSWTKVVRLFMGLLSFIPYQCLTHRWDIFRQFKYVYLSITYYWI